MFYTKNTKIKVIIIQQEAEEDVLEGEEPLCYKDEEEFTWGELTYVDRHPILNYILGDYYSPKKN